MIDMTLGTFTSIPLWLTIPFAVLLLLIALMPLGAERVRHAWEKAYPWVSVILGLGMAAVYLFAVPQGFHIVGETVHEYFSFIALIGALFVAAGGILIQTKGEATPLGNVLFLAFGAVLANFIGTTGASMLLIRPYIRMNRIRISGYHIVFFIFTVSNCGGALTPIGDPPLFLGYLRGVPFFWLLEHVLPAWTFVMGMILAVFFFIDRRSWARMPSKVQGQIKTEGESWRFEGGINVLLLVVIVGAVFLPASYLIRELVMLGAAFASWKLTPRHIHAGNRFNFHPIREVGFLFIGIFLTMMPALGYLKQHGRELGLSKPAHYYYACGGLSAALDNAPTYLNFLQLAQSSVEDAREHAVTVSDGHGGTVQSVPETLSVPELIEHSHGQLLMVAISLGAVFFGAMTYIGNGPNFMVKSIAESEQVRMPGFFGYLGKYSLPLLFPILILAGVLFL